VCVATIRLILCSLTFGRKPNLAFCDAPENPMKLM
jgi:hypothetical protein